MADSIQMQVTRYDPDRDSKPTVATYEVPLRKDWAILDGLNYVKDHVDSTTFVSLVVPDGHLRQLRDERRRHAEADVCHLPQRLRAWAGPGGAADQLPGCS